MRITISTSPESLDISSFTRPSLPQALSSVKKAADFELVAIDIAEEVLVSDEGVINESAAAGDRDHDHSMLLSQLRHSPHSPLIQQQQQQYQQDQNASVDSTGNTFAFHYESPMLSKIVATNCDHDYSSPGHNEIFVSVLTKDNKRIKFVIE